LLALKCPLLDGDNFGVAQRTFHFAEGDIESRAHDDKIVWSEFDNHSAGRALHRIKARREVDVRSQLVAHTNRLLPILPIRQSLQDGVQLACVLIPQNDRKHRPQHAIGILEERSEGCSLSAFCRVVDSERAEADAVEVAEGWYMQSRQSMD